MSGAKPIDVVCRINVNAPGLTAATMAPMSTTRKMNARTHTSSCSATGAGWRRARTGPAGRRATAPDGARWIGNSAVTIADSGCATAAVVRVGADDARTSLVVIGSASSEYSDVVSCESVIVGSSSSRRCQQSVRDSAVTRVTIVFNRHSSLRVVSAKGVACRPHRRTGYGVARIQSSELRRATRCQAFTRSSTLVLSL